MNETSDTLSVDRVSASAGRRAWDGCPGAATGAAIANMTFFLTGNGLGRGGDLGGIEGADKHCQMLAARAGAGGKPGAPI